MAKRSKLLAVAGLMAASAMLSGCVIVANEGGETTRIMTIDQAKAATDLGMVRRFSADGAVVQATVWSNCEGSGSFEVQLTDQTDSQDFVIRVRDDAKCEGDMRDVALQWTYDVLGLKAGERVNLINRVII